MLLLESDTDTEETNDASDPAQHIAWLRAVAEAIARGERPWDQRIIDELELVESLLLDS